MNGTYSFSDALSQTQDRMAKAQMQMLEYAISHNWKVVGQGICYDGGPELIRFEIPEKNRLPHSPESYDFPVSDLPIARANIERKAQAAKVQESIDEYEQRTGKCYDCGKKINDCICG